MIRDTFSSFTVASIIENEKHDTLRNALIISISSLRPNPQSSATVRIDNARGFIALLNDVFLKNHNIFLEDGRIHNKNKNPVIDKGIQELGSELLRMYPEGGPVSQSQLGVVVNQLNSRIRNRGVSSWEILNQRDQYTGEQLALEDLKLSEQQREFRVGNQVASAKNKAKGKPPAKCANIEKGSLVYIKSEGSKNSCRERYIVVDLDEEHCRVQKFVKSQLRSKQYQLKLTEVYPVVPDSIVIPGKIRGLEDSSEETEEITNELHSVPHSIDVVPHHRRDLASRNDETEYPSDIMVPQADYSAPAAYRADHSVQNVDSVDYVVNTQEDQLVGEPELSISDRVEDCSALEVYCDTDSVPNNCQVDVPSASASAVCPDLPCRPKRQVGKPKWMRDYVDL